MGNKAARIKELYREGVLLDKIYSVIAGPFQFTPKQETDNYSLSHINKGHDYDSIFTRQLGTNMIWAFEQLALTNAFGQRSFYRHLDFAGGTGRMAAFIADRCEEQYILDISEKMLTVARKRLPNCNIICKDFNDKIPELDEIKFDLITAFRFFPNAEEKLRLQAIQFISSKLNKGGILVCNNHRNFWSLSYLFSRLTLKGGRTGMTHKQMLSLADSSGLELVETYSMGVIPQTETKTAFFSWKITRVFEDFIFKTSTKKHLMGYNIIYIFKKKRVE